MAPFITMIAVIILTYVLVNVYHKKAGAQYDERQRIIRGDAYCHSLMIILFFEIVCIFSALYMEKPLFDNGVSSVIAISLGITVFSTECIARDAYLSFAELKNNAKYTMMHTVFAVMHIVLSINTIRDGYVIDDGMLTMSVTQVAMTVPFVATAVAMIAKTLCSKMGEENEKS